MEIHPFGFHFNENYLIKKTYKINITTMKTTQGILKAPKVVFNFRNIGFKGLPTLGVGSMQSFFLLVVSASQSLMFLFQWIILIGVVFNVPQCVGTNTLM
jgi:hypothetical protein